MYYHGTLSRRAIDALLSGDPLQPQRPVGAGRLRVAASLSGVSYLTPSFGQASNYACMLDRADWPDEHEFEVSPEGFIFGFDLDDLPRDKLMLEEDDLGWAALMSHAVHHGRRGRMVNGKLVSRGGLVSSNHRFSFAIEEDAETIESLSALFLQRFANDTRVASILENPGYYRASVPAYVGHRLRKLINPGLHEKLLDLGISVGVKGPLVPVAAWSFEYGPTRRPPQMPEDAAIVQGPWTAAVPTL